MIGRYLKLLRCITRLSIMAIYREGFLKILLLWWVGVHCAIYKGKEDFGAISKSLLSKCESGKQYRGSRKKYGLRTNSICLLVFIEKCWLQKRTMYS
jgi:hypothetical protein